MYHKRFQFSSSEVKIDQELEEQLRISIQNLMTEQSILQCNEEDFKVNDIQFLFEPINIDIVKKEESILLNINRNQFWSFNIELSGTTSSEKKLIQNWIIDLSFIELSNDGNYEVINHDFRFVRRLN